MFVSLNWLKDYVDIPKNISPEELGKKLTLHTVEIDDVISEADKYDKVVVGKILEVKKHPDADKLRLAQVQTSTSDKVGNEIVCGAPNIEAGQMVPVALVGAVLPNGMEIKPAKIRGVESNGMLCAEDELSLGDDHSGIMILDKKAKIGQPFGEYLKLNDTILEVDNKAITNRPDLWGHYGLAREISAFLETEFKTYKPKIQLEQIKADKSLKCKIENYSKCKRYMGVGLSGIMIKSSPQWMQERLVAVGIRPINNIVDITNYVMLETGQPLHAFDQGLVDEIVVRPAKDKEEIVTLDGEKRILDKNDLVIADSKKPIAIAGVMGGENSEINNDTSDIIIESANFDAITVRQTSKKFNLRTEASQRFEKSLDPELCEFALVRTVELIQEICPDAKININLCDNKKYNINQGPIELDLKWLNKFIGVELSTDDVVKKLEALGFIIEKKDTILSVTIPTWRASKDISIKEDLAEEIARIIGYENIEAKMPAMDMKAPKLLFSKKVVREVKNILSYGANLTEVYNYAFTGEEQMKKLGADTSDYIKLANPISKNHTLLKQNLAPNLLMNLKLNQARYDSIYFYEISNVFLAHDGSLNKNNNTEEKLPYQESRIGMVISDDNEADVFPRIKGIVEYLFIRLDLKINFEPSNNYPNWADKNSVAKVICGKEDLGFVYMLDQKAQKRTGIKKSVAIAEISLKLISSLLESKANKKYIEFKKFPPAVRDLAFVVDQKVLYNDIRSEIINFHEHITETKLFDVYQGEKLGAGKKSLAFHVTYQADKTLTNEEVDDIQSKLFKHMEEKFEAKIRDF